MKADRIAHGRPCPIVEALLEIDAVANGPIAQGAKFHAQDYGVVVQPQVPGIARDLRPEFHGRPSDGGPRTEKQAVVLVVVVAVGLVGQKTERTMDAHP